MTVEFMKNFPVSQPPARVLLRVRAFGSYALYVNGVLIHGFEKNTGDWKKTGSFDITGYLKRNAENSIIAYVGNVNGPPLLWLSVNGLNPHIGSDASWRLVPLNSFRPVRAVIADDTLPNPVSFKDPGPWASMASKFSWLALFFLASMGAFLLFRLPALKGVLKQRALPGGALVIVVLALVYVFVHNLPRLPWWRGFDVSGHIAYLKRLVDGGGLPLATDGWEMYNPPLFYAIASAVYKLVYSLWGNMSYSFYGVKMISFASGTAQAALAYIASGLVFPGDAAKRAAAVVFAGLLPMNIYISQYISNESFAAALASATLVCAFWIMKKQKPSAGPFIILGILLGMTLLAKMTAFVLTPAILLALIADCIKKKAGLRRTAGLIAGALIAAFLVCGWFYIRNWIYLGNPAITNMDIAFGGRWWMDPGYHSIKYFTRFGMVFTAPFFSGFHSFWDGIYSTMWGDGLFSGTAYAARPGWNYSFMSLVYLLSVPAAILLLAGLCLAFRDFITQGSPAGLLIVSSVCLFGFVIITLALQKPYYAIPKAFYGLSLEMPLSLAFAAAMGGANDWLKLKKLNVARAVLFGWSGTLALSILAAFYI